MKFTVLIFSLMLAQFAFSADLKKTSVSWQLGPESSSYNLDIGISKKSTLGIHYQQQFAQRRDGKTTYMLNGFSNYGLNYEYFLSREKQRYQSGVVLTAGVHYTKLDENSIHQEITLEEKETFKPGDAKVGARIAASYRWYGPSIFAGAGIEGSKVGDATTFLPLKVQLGILF